MSSEESDTAGHVDLWDLPEGTYSELLEHSVQDSPSPQKNQKAKASSSKASSSKAESSKKFRPKRKLQKSTKDVPEELGLSTPKEKIETWEERKNRHQNIKR